MDKLSIANEMREFDRKNRAFYDELTPEEQKKFAPFLMIRWGSSVESSPAVQEYYLRATNEYLNKHFFSINASRHKKLLWLLATTVSPDVGSLRHTWIAPRKKDNATSQHRKKIAELFPHLKDDEIAVMAQINTPQDIEEYVQQLGEQ